MRKRVRVRMRVGVGRASESGERERRGVEGRTRKRKRRKRWAMEETGSGQSTVFHSDRSAHQKIICTLPIRCRLSHTAATDRADSILMSQRKTAIYLQRPVSRLLKAALLLSFPLHLRGTPLLPLAVALTKKHPCRACVCRMLL